MKENYIKIDRKILSWEWYKNINTKVLFIHMLLKANWKDGKFEGKVIPRGSFVSSIKKLSDETELTEREVRTGISHLKMTGELTSKSYSKHTVFTINNYDLYQTIDKQNDIQPPSKRHSNDILTTTIEEKKERKKERNNTMCKADALALFEKLWKLYPVKKGKGQVSDSAKMRLFKVGFDEMERAIDRYKTELEKDSDWRKPQNGSTFFNSGYVDYLDDNYVPEKRKFSKVGQFNRFPQNDYDFEQLEKDILAN